MQRVHYVDGLLRDYYLLTVSGFSAILGKEGYSFSVGFEFETLIV
jgi:hypothetical protein